MKNNEQVVERVTMQPETSKCRVWLVSNEQQLKNRIGAILEPSIFQIIEIGPDKSDQQYSWIQDIYDSGFIVLDIDNDVNWGFAVIEQIKRRRITSPIIVITEDFSRDFGERILSQGVRYYFPHDFSKTEFYEVVHNLEKPCA